MSRYVALHSELRLELGHRERRLKREIDVVAEEEVAGLRALAEAGKAIPAGSRGLQDLAVVAEVEGAAHRRPSTQ